MNTVIRAFGRTQFVYSSSSLPANAVVEAMVVPLIDVTDSATIQIVLRFHSGTTLSAGQKVEVVAVADAPCDQDPGVFFRTPTANPNGIATLTNSSGAAPAAVIASVGLPVGDMITLILRFTQTNVAIAVDVTLSCDIVLATN